jgi:dTDP-4-amino-4,6-dideoxygalactose transaminase
MQALDGSGVTLPQSAAHDGDHVFHQFVIQSDDREGLREHLAAAGVATAIHYPVPIHRTPAYTAADTGQPSQPVSELLASRILSLPMHPAMTQGEIGVVAEAVRSFAG